MLNLPRFDTNSVKQIHVDFSGVTFLSFEFQEYFKIPFFMNLSSSEL
jgi:hypothetical protein